MITKVVHIGELAYEDIRDIIKYIISVSRLSHAERYVDEIVADLETLSYMATILPAPIFDYPKRFHPNAKIIKIRNKPLCAIFHIDGDYLIVDRIVHSSMIIY